MIRRVHAGSGAIATGPPWFLAFILFDGDSAEFNTFIHERINTLGAAWGKGIVGRRIGNPGERDALYEQIRTVARARLDEEAVPPYEQLVKARGSEVHHILREAEELARLLKVPRRMLPAIAFRTLPPASKLAILRVRPSWLANPEAKRTLSQALQTFLSPDRVGALIQTAGREVEDLTRQMQSVLDALSKHVRRRLSGRGPGLQRPPKDYSLEKEARQHLLVVEERTHRVFFKRRELQLTNQPFRLLVFLAQTALEGPGWISGLEIEEHLWPGNENVKSHRLTNAVRRLRYAFRSSHRIGSRDVRDLVMTQRNAGHRLNLLPQDIQIF